MGNNSSGKWNKMYRLSLVEDNTHLRMKSWRFTGVGFVVAAVTVVVVVSILAWCIIALTPLRTTIPGYPDAHFKRGAIANALKIDSLQNEMTRWALYAENLSRVLSGEAVVIPDSLLASSPRDYLKGIEESEIARNDSMLRTMVNQSQQFGLSDRKRELPLEGQHFFTPLKGTVSQPFDIVLHPAVDITAPANSVVSAVLAGTVILADWSDVDGYTLCIQHEGGIVSFYKHNQKLLRKVGDEVSAGTPIALVGSTGAFSKGDHLHFELWYNGVAEDPAKYCKF